jgi:hypothetical protein
MQQLSPEQVSELENLREGIMSAYHELGSLRFTTPSARAGEPAANFISRCLEHDKARNRILDRLNMYRGNSARILAFGAHRLELERLGSRSGIVSTDRRLERPWSTHVVHSVANRMPFTKAA